ncbi:MAG: ribosomal protein L7/L12 [Phycisphaeraceae bacterium]|nr:ribosomal protein L7/L12 [Phycisphaeraceae bacterium]
MGLFGNNDGSLAARVSRLERQLAEIMGHLGIEPDDDGLDQVRDLMNAGKKIEAIKEYRQRTGAGLAEAKQAVEQGV